MKGNWEEAERHNDSEKQRDQEKKREREKARNEVKIQRQSTYRAIKIISTEIWVCVTFLGSARALRPVRRAVGR